MKKGDYDGRTSSERMVFVETTCDHCREVILESEYRFKVTVAAMSDNATINVVCAQCAAKVQD